MTRERKEPGPDHPIEIFEQAGRITVAAAGRRIAETRHALALKEAELPLVIYMPRDNGVLEFLERSDHTTWCPYKGEASYFHIKSPDGGLIKDAVWTYETPFPAVAAIKNHLAFYTSKIDVMEIWND